MATLCICHDSSKAPALRISQRQAHFDYIESIIDELLVAGPLKPDSESPDWQGSLFIYATDDEQSALKLLHNDPYYRSGVYRQVECQPFLPAAGTWVGGVSWQNNAENKE